MRLMAAACALAFAVACGEASTAPPGFLDACYGGRADPGPRRGKVDVSLYTYRPDARFEPIARSLETKLVATWKERAKVEQFPAVLPAKKALPDVVRAQLLEECSAAPIPKPYHCEGF